MLQPADPPRRILQLAFGEECPERSLIVFSVAGLSNRLRLLTSGMALAEATGRTFVMLWAPTPDCGARFDELFENQWPVVNLSTQPAELSPFDLISLSDRRRELLRKDPRQHLVVGYYTWLIRPPRNADRGHAQRRCLGFVSQLQPTAIIRERVESFRSRHFRPKMIGVHLRRGDYLRFRPHDVRNVEPALAAVDQFLEIEPEAGILLATDDGALDPYIGQMTAAEGLHAVFQQRYGKRVIWYPVRSLDRRASESIQDAAVDLWLLRSTNYFVGSLGSSFSATVMTGRDTPHVFCGAETPNDIRVARIIRSLGLAPLARLAARRRFGNDVAFSIACRWFVRMPLAPVRWLRAIH